MNWSADRWTQIAAHAAFVASQLREMEGSVPFLSAGSVPVPSAPTFPAPITPYGPSNGFGKGGISCSGLPRLHPLHNQHYARIPNKGCASAAQEDKLSKLDRIRKTERNKKKRHRDKSAMLLKCLEALLPPPTGDRPRSFHETLADAVNSVRRMQAPVPFKTLLLSTRSVGILVLDTDLKVITCNTRFVELVGGRRPQPGISSRDIIAEADFADLTLVSSQLIRRNESAGSRDGSNMPAPDPQSTSGLDRFVIGLRFHGAETEYPVEMVWCAHDAPPDQAAVARTSVVRPRGTFFAFVVPLLPVGHPSACAARAVSILAGLRPGERGFMHLEVERGSANRRGKQGDTRRGDEAPTRPKGHTSAFGDVPITFYATPAAAEFLLRGLRDKDWSEAEAWLTARPDYPQRNLLLASLRDLASPERRRVGPGCTTVLEVVHEVLANEGSAAGATERQAAAAENAEGAPDRSKDRPKGGMHVIWSRMIVDGLCLSECNLLGGGSNRAASRGELPMHSQLRVGHLMSPGWEGHPDPAGPSKGQGSAGGGGGVTPGVEASLERVGERQNEFRVVEGGNGVWFSRHIRFSRPADRASTNGPPDSEAQTITCRRNMLSVLDADGIARFHQLNIDGDEVRMNCIRYRKVQPPTSGSPSWRAWPGREPEGLSGLALRNALFDLFAAMRANKTATDSRSKNVAGGERDGCSAGGVATTPRAEGSGLDSSEAQELSSLRSEGREWWDEMGARNGFDMGGGFLDFDWL